MARPFRTLSAGARIGLFAPSSPFPEERYAKGVETLSRMGFEPVEAPSLRHARGYLAGTDEERVASLQALLDDPTIDALLAVRGGYGLHRILPRLSIAALGASDRPIIGFSDLTALHALCALGDRASVHGPVLTQLGELGEPAERALRAVLAGEAHTIEYTTHEPPIRGGRARGPLFGGCLSVLTPLVGTPYWPSLEGHILLLEDVGEATYRLDRLLTHLRLAGVLSGVAGVAVGELTQCEPRKTGEFTAREVIEDRLGDLGVPVVMGLPFGHGQRNLAVPLGAVVELDADAGQLRVEPWNQGTDRA